MKKRIGLILTCVAVISLTGCQSITQHHDSELHKTTQSSNTSHQMHSKKTSQFNEESSTEQNTESIVHDSTDTISSATAISESNSSTTSGINSTTVKISNATEAENYLKQQLGYSNNSDVVPGNDPEYNGTDQNGQYYTVSLVSMSDKLHGKTGSMGIYRVYEDGTIVHVAQ